MADGDDGSSGRNNRVTLAIVQRDVLHLTEQVRQWREDAKDDAAALRNEVCKKLDDHEARLRTLEGSRRQGNWQDLGTAIGAGIGIVLGALGLKN